MWDSAGFGAAKTEYYKPDTLLANAQVHITSPQRSLVAL